MDSKVSVLKIDPRHFPQTGLFEVWLFLLGPINITKGPIAERSKPSDLDCGRGHGFKSRWGGRNFLSTPKMWQEATATSKVQPWKITEFIIQFKPQNCLLILKEAKRDFYNIEKTNKHI